MDHLCYKCQASIDESLPFCPHCGAPQIRVATPEPESTQQPVAPLRPTNVAPVWGTAPQAPAYTVQWEVAWKGALLAGLMAGVLSSIPVVSLGFCLWILGAGIFSVLLYQRRIPGVVTTPGMGLRIGAFAGMIAFITDSIFTVIRYLENSDDFRKVFVEQMQSQASRNSDPRAQELVQRFINNLSTPEGLATMFVLAMIVSAVVFLVFSAAGGALGASMFGRRNPR